jgi:tetratricopeptide (TPR) repeat protein/tRNA A-37 threonylcarbamoyl transferase component Bud32
VAEIPARLVAALSGRYALLREAGSGGMATVYLAEDVRHQRKVAVKVLRPELSATLGPDRFTREIKIAAQLSHPHILPVLDSGEADGYLYYVMPFIEGESLRERLNRQGELPVTEAVRILVEVTDALAHAHARGVVHRDMKPDNVMITGRHALVMDFGVAKAVSEASGHAAMTTAGIAMGTPAYMAPEQAAADPNVDHRADLYALGATAYELLTGRPPFTGRTAQEVLAAHVTQRPEPITSRRPALPPALGTAIMRCLEKRPADRYQTAEELLAVLEPIGTPSGGITPAQTAPYPAATVDRWYGHPSRVGGMFLVAALAVLGVVYFLTIQLGLPDWVIKGAAALLAAGFPIMLVTGMFERRRAVARATGMFVASSETTVHRWFTWRKALLGGAMAFGVLGLGVGAYTAMRLLGIGPVGTLVAAGHLKASDRLIVADFTNRSSDSTLGPSVTEAFRIDLAQSPLVTLVGSSALGDALDRMKQPRNAVLTPELARELAQREGAKAVVVGDISPVGKGYVLTARLVAPQDGTELVALRETANDDGQILKAIDRLSRSMRERIGESLRSIRANEPLEQVTTGSLEALRLYTEGNRAANLGESEQAISLLKQAVAIDTGFAMAWRKLAVAYSNSGSGQALVNDAATRAYAHRDRLPEMERDQTVAFYFWRVENDRDKAAEAYRAVLRLDPDNLNALVNLSNILTSQRQWAEAESLGIRAVRAAPGIVNSYSVTLGAQLPQGKVTAAQATLDRALAALPGNTGAQWLRVGYFTATGNLDSIQAITEAIGRTAREANDREGVAWTLSSVATARGHLRQAAQHLREVLPLAELRQLPADRLAAAFSQAGILSVFLNDQGGALRVLDSALQREPLDRVPLLDRPYAFVTITYALAGQPATAKRFRQEYQASVPEAVRSQSNNIDWMDGYIALSEGKGREALTAFHRARERGSCTNCGYFEMGQSYEMLDMPDSALAQYTLAVETPYSDGSLDDRANNEARAFRRLGVLYDQKGDKQKALDYYGRFVARWRDADPELQPQVKEAKARMAALAGEPK